MDKPSILFSPRDLLARGVKPFETNEEIEKADWNDNTAFERGFVTQYLAGIEELKGEVAELIKRGFEEEKSKTREKWEDWLDRASTLTKTSKVEISNVGRSYIEDIDPKKRSLGLQYICQEPISELFRELSQSNVDINKLRDITEKAYDMIKRAGAWNIPVGRNLISPSAIRANLTTTTTAGGYLIDSVFIPRIIEELYEAFPLMDRFTSISSATGSGTQPRISAGSTAYRRTEGSAGTATGITFSQLSYTCTPMTAFTVATKEWFMTADASFQVQSLVLGRLARAMAYLYKYEFVNGTGSSQMTGIETENTSGYLQKATLTENKIKSIMDAMPLLGGTKEVDWINRAVVVGNKTSVWSVANEAYTDEKQKLDIAQPISALNIRGVRFEMVETVPDNVFYIMVPDLYLIFRVPQLTTMSIDDTGYTHQTTNTITFLINDHSDGKLDANGLGASYKTRYPVVRVAP